VVALTLSTSALSPHADLFWRSPLRIVTVVALLVIVPAPPALAQQATQNQDQATLTIYGSGQGDAIVDFKQNDPSWYDVNRPTKLPASTDQFGENGHFYLSPRQSQFGAKATIPTSNGDVTAVFEFDMLGVGAEAGQTAFHLLRAYGQWKQVGAGQKHSQFVDVDVFPHTLDYWGPNGMLGLRNTQVFWQFYKNGDSNAAVAIENPGASNDVTLVSNGVELQAVRARFPAPDLTGHYRFGRPWGYVQFGAALRYIAWDDVLPNDPLDLSGHVWGWGVSVSSNVKINDYNTLRLQYVNGEGIENYVNDAPVGVGAQRNPGNAVTPVVGDALPVWSMVAYLEHNWNKKWSSVAGYSRVDIRNSDLQQPNSFRIGQYATANLLCTPVDNVMIGGEVQWAKRQNFSDGFSSNDYRLEFSFKYSFSAKIIGG
jgi:hypothetical protein